MKTFSKTLLGAALLIVLAIPLRAEDPLVKTPAEIFGEAFRQILATVEPEAGTPAKTLSATLEIVKVEGLPKELAGQNAELAFQSPDRVTLTATIQERRFAVGRDRQSLWAYVPDKKFGVVGTPGVARFASAPGKKDAARLDALKLPLPKEQLILIPMLVKIESLPAATIEGVRCHVLQVTPKPEAREALHLLPFRVKLWLRETDLLPARVDFTDGKTLAIDAILHDVKLAEAWPEEKWKIPSRDGDTIETTALSHLTRFLSVALSSFGQTVPPLGPARGDRRVVATEGKGRLDEIDGTRVLFLKGSPEEMGRQHGTLLRREIRNVTDRILYGVGVGSSFEKGKWFFGEIERAQARLAPFMDRKYLLEMDALALASGADREEIRLANYFPELFHCSGFALFGEATAGGRMYHGRILDYLKGVGLEQNAVVIVAQPDYGHAWVNISYAGFIGSVTAMNEKHLSIGEMGGRGEGHWDGKPMAQLVREVMERASTIDEAVEIMRKGPRTCEYYYVIADAKSKRAVGIAATPDKFETVWAGEAHPKLPHAIKDAVLMSAGGRYETLAERVKAGHGKFDTDSARDLMTRPVCMGSNIHSVLFEPETLDFWVANADSKNVASHARYTHYNLAELLQGAADGSGPTTATNAIKTAQ